MCSWCGDKERKEESKTAARCGVKGSGVGSSLLWQCVDFYPQVLTLGLDFSAHIHLFNLGKLHLTSCIVWVKEQWMSLYNIVPVWPSGVVLLFYDQWIMTAHFWTVFLSCSVITWQHIFKKSISCWLPRPLVCLSSGHICPVIATGCMNPAFSQWGCSSQPTQPINKWP